MLLFPNAKLNIGLQVIAKRADGYHDLQTAFYPFTGLRDVLEIIEAPKLAFSSSGIAIPGDEQGNLCLKAYRLVQQNYDLPPVHIHLHKNIPIGAGLGGGSSDGAFMLRLLATRFGLSISDDKLAAYAAQLGSDCPFFIYNTPLLASGTGTVFEPSDLDLSAYTVVLICPDIHVSTQQAYAGVKPQQPEHSVKALLQMPLNDWKALLKNDFEVGVFELFPRIAEIKSILYASGALYASMSGSGAAVYGIFKERPLLPDLVDCRIFYQDSISK